MTDSQILLSTTAFADFGEALARLIEDRTLPDAPQQLCAALKNIVAVDSAAIFLLHRDSAPGRLFDEAMGEPVGYIDAPYLLDPLYNLFIRGSVPRTCRMRDIEPDGFRESEYFNQYYRHLDIVDEFYFNFPAGQRSLIHVTLIRTGDNGPYSESEMALLTGLAPIIESILKQFLQAGGGQVMRSDSSADAFHERLSSAFEKFGLSVLTDREKQIVDLTMRGYSDKLTARELAITPGTVRNHKKSIFSKLEVSSQGQLFGLFLDVLELPSNKAFGDDPLLVLRQCASKSA